MCVNIGQKISVTSDHKIMTAAFSNKYRLVATCDRINQVKIFDSDGSEKLRVQLDETDELLMLELYNDELVVGSKEGIVRVYGLLFNKSSRLRGMRLNRIVRCCWEG